MTTQTKKADSRPRTSKKANEADDLQERQRCIAEAAYYKAERRGFAPGKECEDWLEAERELDSTAADR